MSCDPLYCCSDIIDGIRRWPNKTCCRCHTLFDSISYIQTSHPRQCCGDAPDHWWIARVITHIDTRDDPNQNPLLTRGIHHHCTTCISTTCHYRNEHKCRKVKFPPSLFLLVSCDLILLRFWPSIQNSDARSLSDRLQDKAASGMRCMVTCWRSRGPDPPGPVIPKPITTTFRMKNETCKDLISGF